MIYEAYLICACISLVNRRNSYALFASAIPITLATSFRVNVGKDYPVYQDMFQGLVPVSGIDPAFLYLSHKISEIDSSGQLGFLLTSCIIMLGFVFFINRFSIDKGLSIVIFLSVPIFYISSLNTLRFYLGMSLFLIALSLMNRQIILKTIMMGSAIFMHMSLVLLGPMLFLKSALQEYRALFWLSLLAVMLMVLAVIIFESALIPQSLRYFLLADTNDSRLLVISYAIFSISIAFINYRFDPSGINRFYVLVSSLHSGFCVIWYFSDYGNLFLRISNLFSFVSIITIPIFLKLVLHDKDLRVLARTSIIIFLMGYFSYKYYQDPSFGFY